MGGEGFPLLPIRGIKELWRWVCYGKGKQKATL